MIAPVLGSGCWQAWFARVPSPRGAAFFLVMVWIGGEPANDGAAILTLKPVFSLTPDSRHGFLVSRSMGADGTMWRLETGEWTHANLARHRWRRFYRRQFRAAGGRRRLPRGQPGQADLRRQPGHPGFARGQ